MTCGGSLRGRPNGLHLFHLHEALPGLKWLPEQYLLKANVKHKCLTVATRGKGQQSVQKRDRMKSSVRKKLVKKSAVRTLKSSHMCSGIQAMHVSRTRDILRKYLRL